METSLKAIFDLVLFRHTTILKSSLIVGFYDMKRPAVGKILWRRLVYNLNLATLLKQKNNKGDANWFAINALIMVKFSSK